MSVNIEDILLLKAQQDAANNNNTTGSLVGGTLGTALGALAGKSRHTAGQEQLLQRIADRTQIPNAATPNALNKYRPGARMAGGLVGLMIGGALGAGVQQMAFSESPAARMLAKIQSGSELNPLEIQELEDVLTGTYNSILGA
jgi:outer membrane lipoprotein SlyB